MAMDFGNMGDLMKQAQEMQKKISEMQTDLSQKTVTGTAGGGMVTVTVNGSHELTAIGLEKEVVNPDDIEMLVDLLMAAANDALKKSQEMATTEMSRLTAGLNLPGLMGG